MPKRHKSVAILYLSLHNSVQLQQPRDSKVTDFWVDLNVRSCSISTFVNDDSTNEVSVIHTVGGQNVTAT